MWTLWCDKGRDGTSPVNSQLLLLDVSSSTWLEWTRTRSCRCDLTAAPACCSQLLLLRAAQAPTHKHQLRHPATQKLQIFAAAIRGKMWTLGACSINPLGLWWPSSTSLGSSPSNELMPNPTLPSSSSPASSTHQYPSKLLACVDRLQLRLPCVSCRACNSRSAGPGSARLQRPTGNERSCKTPPFVGNYKRKNPDHQSIAIMISYSFLAADRSGCWSCV